jgi:hypothetical protein
LIKSENKERGFSKHQ